MSPEGKKDSKLKAYAYTIVFILVISAVFTSILAAANAAALPSIQKNTQLAERRAILYVFNLDTTGTQDEVFSRFDQNIQQAQSGDISLFMQVDNQGQALGYAVPFSGPGLWGIIQGYLGVSPDRKEILGVVFTSQNETPGLGGRIDELAFRDPFRGIKIQPGRALVFGVPDEDGRQIDAITGATLTSKSVLKMLNQSLDETVSELEVVPGE